MSVINFWLKTTEHLWEVKNVNKKYFIDYFDVPVSSWLNYKSWFKKTGEFDELVRAGQ